MKLPIALISFSIIPLDCHAFSTLLKTRQQFANPLLKSQASHFSIPATTALHSTKDDVEEDVVDIAIIGAGLGGLCAGAILNTLYGKRVGVYESHYLPGGCAHAFDRKASGADGPTFTFDSGPTILLGCSAQPYNPLAQVLKVVGQDVEWIPYDSWGMIENPTKKGEELRWQLKLGPDHFQSGPLTKFGGPGAVEEFEALREACKGLLGGATIPAMAMRPGGSALVPLLRYLPELLGLIKEGETVTGTFAPFMDGPLFIVKDEWLRDWLDALAFSLSGLPACRTSAAAMAFVLYDMHRPGASLDYPKGGYGEVVNALVKGVEQGPNGSKVNLRQHVDSIDCSDDGQTITGITLKNSNRRVIAKDGVICNAPVWCLNELIKDDRIRQKLSGGQTSYVSGSQKPKQSWGTDQDGAPFIKFERPDSNDRGDEGLLSKADTAEMTGSFLHLHLAIKSEGLDLSKMEAHYTIMDRSLGGDKDLKKGDSPCGELNMIAVSNPCVIDNTLAPEGYMLVHAYGAGNEPYSVWEDLERGNSKEYQELKEQRSESLWRAVESVIGTDDVRQRTVLAMVGSPKTHEFFLRRPRGTYGAATEDYLKDGSTAYDNLVLAGDSIFPGIGMPAVAINGASAANAFVNVFDHWKQLDKLKEEGKL